MTEQEACTEIENEKDYEIKENQYLNCICAWIEYDIDHDDEFLFESEQLQRPPSRLEGNYEFNFLKDKNLLKIKDDKYYLNQDKFGDFISDSVTETTGYCHNGFNYKLLVKEKNESESIQNTLGE